MLTWIPGMLGVWLGYRGAGELLATDGWRFRAWMGVGDARSRLEKLARQLLAIRERLGSGIQPEERDWQELAMGEGAWNGWIAPLLLQLRSRGAAVVPTLVRLEAGVRQDLRARAQARARLAQAWSQALVCGALIPLLGVFIWLVIPEVAQRSDWQMLSVVPALLALGAAAWMIRIGAHASRGGLNAREASWPAFALSAGEVLLAWIRAGEAPDTAWSRMVRWLESACPDLLDCWGVVLWSDGAAIADSPTFSARVRATGSVMRQAIQVSIFEGRPCMERIEQVLEQLVIARDLACLRESELIGTRVLKPLFLCVAPALLGWLALTMWMLVGQEMGLGGS